MNIQSGKKIEKEKEQKRKDKTKAKTIHNN